MTLCYSLVKQRVDFPLISAVLNAGFDSSLIPEDDTPLQGELFGRDSPSAITTHCVYYEDILTSSGTALAGTGRGPKVLPQYK